MQINQTFFKLKLLKDLLKESAKVRQTLLDECIDIGGSNQIVLMRRFRMLTQLSQYESSIIDKIYDFEIVSLTDFTNGLQQILQEIKIVTNRGA
jgi:hypothetical protein